MPIGNPSPATLGFTGEQTDDSGLVYLRARYMNPATGSFITTDPVQGAVGMGSVRWNPYAYAGSNPTTFTDPSGEIFGVLFVAGLMALGGGLISGGVNLFRQINDLRAKNITDFFDIVRCISYGSLVGDAIKGVFAGGLPVIGGFGLVVALAPAPATTIGAVAVALENLAYQTNKIVSEGKAGSFFEALGQVNLAELAFSATYGAAGGSLLGGSGIISSASRSGALAFASIDFVLNNQISPKNIITSGFWSAPLGPINATIAQSATHLISTPILRAIQHGGFYAIAGFGTLTMQHIITDDNPLQDNEPIALTAGFLNAVSVKSGNVGIFLAFLSDAIINVIGNLTDR